MNKYEQAIVELLNGKPAQLQIYYGRHYNIWMAADLTHFCECAETGKAKRMYVPMLDFIDGVKNAVNQLKSIGKSQPVTEELVKKVFNENCKTKYVLT